MVAHHPNACVVTTTRDAGRSALVDEQSPWRDATRSPAVGSDDRRKPASRAMHWRAGVARRTCSTAPTLRRTARATLPPRSHRASRRVRSDWRTPFPRASRTIRRRRHRDKRERAFADAVAARTRRIAPAGPDRRGPAARCRAARRPAPARNRPALSPCRADQQQPAPWSSWAAARQRAAHIGHRREAETTSEIGAVTAFSTPWSDHVVRIDIESLPTGIATPRRTHVSSATARTVS